SGAAATSYRGTITASILGQSAAPEVILSTSAGALTVSGTVADVNGGSLTLQGADGVVVSGEPGNSATGPVHVVGALSGAGSIVEGTGAVSVTQDGNSTFGGSISGNQAFNKAGNGNLILFTSNLAFTGAVNVNAGSLEVDGSLQNASNLTVANGA